MSDDYNNLLSDAQADEGVTATARRLRRYAVSRDAFGNRIKPLAKHHLMREAADIIERQQAEIARLKAGRDHWYMSDLKETGRATAAEAEVADLRAKLAKAVEAIEYYEIGVTAVAVHHPAERKVLHDCVTKARELRTALDAIKEDQP